MNMAPIYDISGQLLGHLNLLDCGQNRHSVIVTNLDQSLLSLAAVPDEEVMSKTVAFFSVPIRTLQFQHSSTASQEKRCLVVDKLPDWFWDAHSTVRFSPDQWIA